MDHLTALLLTGADGTSGGGYNNFDAWSAALRGDDADSPGGRLVTAHEALHAVLNDTTAYGMALAGYAVLTRHGDPGNEAALRKLVDGCRTAHEAFATFGSIWLVGGGDLGLLGGYPAYRGWYRDAADLVPHLPDHDRRKELMIENAVRACMQSPALTRLLDRGLAPDAWRDLTRADRPSDRFAMLHTLADESFWDAAWADCEEAIRGTAALDALRASLRDPRLRDETYDGAYSEAWLTCAELLHRRIAGLLPGASTLGYDEHRTLIPRLIELVEQHAPHTAGLLVPSTDERTVEDEAFEMWRRERLVVRDTPRQVRLSRLSELRRPEHGRLLSQTAGETYVFCAVRPAFRMIEQFRFTDRDAAWLSGLGSQPVVATRSGNTGEDPLDLVLLDEPGQLAAVGRGAPVYVNVSLRCFGDEQWRRRWSGALLRTRLTALFDLSPFQQFDLWQREGDRVAYASGGIRDGARSPADVLAFRVGTNRFPILLLCTAVTRNVLGGYLTSRFPEAVEDPAVLTGDAELIGRTVSHLLTEETWFDLAAYPAP